MGFNLGAFASGLAQGGINTYSTLDDIERKQKADAREEERMGAWRKEQEGKEALRTAALEVPTGDTVQTPTFQGMTGSYDQQDAPMRTEAITPEQKNANFRQRALALGADPMAVQDYEARGLQADAARMTLKKGGFELKSLQRQDDLDTQIDAERKSWQQDMVKMKTRVDDTFAKDGITGIRKEFAPELKQAGVTMDVVGNKVTLKQGKNVLEAFDVKEAPQVLEKYLGMHYVQGFGERLASKGLFKTPAEAIDYAFKTREAARKDRDTDSAIALRGAQTTEALSKADANRAYGKAIGQKTGIWSMVGTDSDGQPVSYDRNTGSFARPDGKPVQDPSIFKKLTGERAPVSPADINSFLEKQSGTVVRIDERTKKPVTLGQLPLAEQRRIAMETLGGPAAPATGGLPDADGSKMVRPGQAAPQAQPQAAALPTKSATPSTYGNIDPHMQREAAARVQALDAEIAQVEIRAAAAARSEDPRAIIQYGNVLNALRAQREQAASSPLLK
jgi:hypothetical protein